MLTGALASRVQPQGKLSGDPLSLTSCHRGMHIKLEKSLSDQHAVNPDAQEEEEQHFVLSEDLPAGQSESGPCSELVKYPVPAWERLRDYEYEPWDADDLVSWDFLHGTIEVSCEQEDGKLSLKVRQYSCRELLPFAVVWENDDHEVAQVPKEEQSLSKSEYAEFTCADPLKASANLLHMGSVKVLEVVSSLDSAQSACDADARCKAIAMAPSSKFHLLEGFSCPFFAAEAFHSSFHAGDEVKLRLLQGQESGTVLESWSLQDPDVQVLVQFAGAAQYVLPEHLVKTQLSNDAAWTVFRKIRERKVSCQTLQRHASCDIYSKAMVQELKTEATPSSCRAACLERLESSPHLQRCCVLSDAVCALTQGELFDAEEDAEPIEWAANCYQQPCSADPSCAIGNLPSAPLETLETEEELQGLMRFFDFAHPLAPYLIDSDQNTIYHFAGKPSDHHVIAAMKDKHRLLRVVGHGPKTSTSHSSFGKLRDVLVSKEKREMFQEKIGKACEAFGQSIGRKLLAPDLAAAMSEEAVLSKCEAGVHQERCLVKAGCVAESRQDPDHEWLPFSPMEFSQLPYDLLAWQTPAPFCCAASYTLDVRKETMLKVVEEMAEVKHSSAESVKDEVLRKDLKDSIKSGSLALKKTLMHHVADTAELDWLGQLVRTAASELKKLLVDLEESVDSEGSEDIEITEDGTAFIQVNENGNHTTPSGRLGVVIARWSAEHGAFLQTDPTPSKFRKAVNFLASVPGAIYHYGVKPLWNFVAKPLLKWGISLTKWILEHPRAALFITKFGVLMRDQMCEKVSWHIYGDPGTTAVGAMAYASNSAQQSTPQNANTPSMNHEASVA